MNEKEQIAIKQHLCKPRPIATICGCLGRQGNEPLCPCQMKWCENVDGDWYQITEHRSVDGITHSAKRL